MMNIFFKLALGALALDTLKNDIVQGVVGAQRQVQNREALHEQLDELSAVWLEFYETLVTINANLGTPDMTTLSDEDLQTAKNTVKEIRRIGVGLGGPKKEMLLNLAQLMQKELLEYEQFFRGGLGQNFTIGGMQ
jgi:hypothetical protein